MITTHAKHCMCDVCQPKGIGETKVAIDSMGKQVLFELQTISKKPPTLDPKGAAGKLKPQLHLNPPAGSEEQAKAHALGAERYGPFNWRKNKVEFLTYISAMKRHIDRLMDDEDIDPESGAHHLGHVMANCAIVLDAKRHGTLVDNRPTINESNLPQG